MKVVDNAAIEAKPLDELPYGAVFKFAHPADVPAGYPGPYMKVRHPTERDEFVLVCFARDSAFLYDRSVPVLQADAHLVTGSYL